MVRQRALTASFIGSNPITSARVSRKIGNPTWLVWGGIVYGIIAYFTSEGYTISTPLNDTQWYDLIIEKNGKFETV